MHTNERGTLLIWQGVLTDEQVRQVQSERVTGVLLFSLYATKQRYAAAHVGDSLAAHLRRHFCVLTRDTVVIRSFETLVHNSCEHERVIEIQRARDAHQLQQQQQQQQQQSDTASDDSASDAIVIVDNGEEEEEEQGADDDKYTSVDKKKKRKTKKLLPSSSYKLQEDEFVIPSIRIARAYLGNVDFWEAFGRRCSEEAMDLLADQQDAGFHDDYSNDDPDIIAAILNGDYDAEKLECDEERSTDGSDSGNDLDGFLVKDDSDDDDDDGKKSRKRAKDEKKKKKKKAKKQKQQHHHPAETEEDGGAMAMVPTTLQSPDGDDNNSVGGENKKQLKKKKKKKKKKIDDDDSVAVGVVVALPVDTSDTTAEQNHDDDDDDIPLSIPVRVCRPPPPRDSPSNSSSSLPSSPSPPPSAIINPIDDATSMVLEPEAPVIVV
jgi:hypothetical protein